MLWNENIYQFLFRLTHWFCVTALKFDKSYRAPHQTLWIIFWPLKPQNYSTVSPAFVFLPKHPSLIFNETLTLVMAGGVCRAWRLPCCSAAALTHLFFNRGSASAAATHLSFCRRGSGVYLRPWFIRVMLGFYVFSRDWTHNIITHNV